MMGTWRDVSIPMHPDMVVWPGDPPFRFEPNARIARGDSCNTSTISMSTHTGTHCDAPWHFEADGKRLHEIHPTVFFGNARVLDMTDVADTIRAEHLGDDPLPPRVLFKTRMSARPVDAAFDTQFVALDTDAAERLVADGVRLVGVDYLSVAPYKQPGQPTHHTLLRNDVFVVEGLRLEGIAGGTYPFVVLPLPLVGADGAPCRAFIQV